MALLPWFRTLHIAATVLIGGAFAFDILILRRCGDAARDLSVTNVVSRWSKQLCLWGLALALVSWAGWLAATATSMSGLDFSQAVTPDVLGTLLARTTFGHVWCVRLALFVVLGMLMTTRAGKSIASAFVAAALVASLAWTGHALGTNHLHVWVDAAHMLAAAAWVGMLPLLLLVMTRAAAQAGTWRDLGVACAKCFFVPGIVAVIVLAASGVANTSWMIDSVADLWQTGYGRVLSLKLALFALMLLLAAVNRFVIVPRVERGAGTCGSLRSLRASVLAELLLGAAVIAVVACLGVTPPAAHEHQMHEHEMQ
ncbi:MAG TPA: CopD family protein [Ramlibacter sp.]